MSNTDLNLVVSLSNRRSSLYIHGLITEAENARIKGRIEKFAKSRGIVQQFGEWKPINTTKRSEHEIRD